MRGPAAKDELIRRITLGDRDALGEFVLQYGPLLRRRMGGKLGPRMRRVFDSADILSTVLRRIVHYASAHEIHARSESELWALIMKVADAAVLQKVRLIGRLKRVEADDAPFAELMDSALGRDSAVDEDSDDAVIDTAFAAIESPDDQRILWLWLSGMELRTIAELTGRTPECTRKRWELIRKRVRASLDSKDRIHDPGHSRS